MDPAESLDEFPFVDYGTLTTEGNQPVESVYHDRQMRLLVDILYTSWKPGRPFVACAGVGLFAKDSKPPVVAHVLVSLDVDVPPGPGLKLENRSYFIWKYGKWPDVMIEVVSSRDTPVEKKLSHYAQIGVGYIVLWDPEKYLSKRPLRAFELHGKHYVDLVTPWLEDLGLGLATWHGEYQGMTQTWLRWTDAEGHLLPCVEEAMEAQRQATHIAEAAVQAERERADRLAERLRALGVDDV